MGESGKPDRIVNNIKVYRPARHQQLYTLMMKDRGYNSTIEI